ncbi:hypothetical protein [Moraxella oculi]|uniref:Uncharacterized protein n=1 Tax=Moraxella oculi TaxID=2940516 RepID=A0ABW8U6G7_9GAMM
MMEIFQNDHEVLTIGNLTIENQLDKIIIHGDVEIGRDGVGRMQAQALYDFAWHLIKTLDGLPDVPVSESSTTQSDTTINPFV